MLKVITVVGTRPEIIRLSRIIPILDKYCLHTLVHTGQNYDYELNQIFFNELQIRKPDRFLNISNKSLGQGIGDLIIKSEQLFKEVKPNALLVLGDTNSSLVTIMSKRMKIPVYHMEAGNRCFDSNVPEEVNRKIVDHISDFNLVYTEHARRNLLGEGIHPRFIYLTGSPMREIIDFNLQKIMASNILNQLDLNPREYFLVSLHREENVDNQKTLQKLIMLLEAVEKEFKSKIIVSTHPRTNKRMDYIGFKNKNKNIHFLKPFGYFDYSNLQLNAQCVLSDSGTVSEESAILGFPAITLRNSMERPEALDSGTISLTSYNEEEIVQNIKIAVQLDSDIKKRITTVPHEYQIKNTSQIVLKLIMGTAKISNKWLNIDDFNRYDF